VDFSVVEIFCQEQQFIDHVMLHEYLERFLPETFFSKEVIFLGANISLT